MIEVKNLRVSIDKKEILKGINLKIEAGSAHVMMGPNGAGKSTLSRVFAGDPFYEVTEGEIWFKGKNILEIEPEERALLGLFVGFQYPIEVPGISNFEFLHEIFNSSQKARGKPALSEEEFSEILLKKMESMDMKKELQFRGLNEGFSGGEKKRNEILQMSLLDPDFAVLDETDSGLDIDAMRIIARGISQMQRQNKAFLVITHYQRLLDLIHIDEVHVLIDGNLVCSDGPQLVKQLEEKGYDWLGASATKRSGSEFPRRTTTAF